MNTIAQRKPRYTPAQSPVLCIWSRTFSKDIATIGKIHGVFIDVFKELQRELGKTYDYVASVISLSRRFGHGFHLSNEQFLECMPGIGCDRTLKRRKAKYHELGIVIIGHGCKNRTFYYLNEQWFEAFLSRLFTKLGVQLGQNDPSHIISIISSEREQEKSMDTPTKTAPREPIDLIAVGSLIKKSETLGLTDQAIIRLIRQHGLNVVTEKLDMLAAQKGVHSPYAWLVAAICGNWRSRKAGDNLNGPNSGLKADDAPISVAQYVSEAIGTKLYDKAVSALKEMGTSQPIWFFCKKEGMSDSQFEEVEKTFNNQLSDKMKELEQRH